MKKATVLFLMLAFTCVLVVAEEAEKACKPPVIESLVDLPDWINEGQFTVTERDTSESNNMNTCPIVLCDFEACINPIGICEGAGCGNPIDTGWTTCTLGSYTLQCSGAKTIHKVVCNRCECPNGTLCEGSGSTSISCQ